MASRGICNGPRRCHEFERTGYSIVGVALLLPALERLLDLVATDSSEGHTQRQQGKHYGAHGRSSFSKKSLLIDITANQGTMFITAAQCDGRDTPS